MSFDLHPSIQQGLDPNLNLHDIRFTTMSYWSNFIFALLGVGGQS
jgi:hypothetical protein